MSIVISGRQAASFKPRATKATESSMKLEQMARAAFGKRHVGRIGAATWISNKSEIAREPLDRIGALCDIERNVAGQPADIRLAARKKYSKAKVEALDDSPVATDNNAAERALRTRRYWLFAGADTGAETLALSGRRASPRIQDHNINRLDELLP